MMAVRGLAVLALLVIASGGCSGDCRVLLSGGLTVGCGDEPPGPGDPAFGSVAEVLVTDCAEGGLLWVGFNPAATPTPSPAGEEEPPSEFSTFELLRCQGELEWIGGTVRVADDHPNGFYFDPNEIVALATTPLETQTTIAAIARDPALFAPEPGEEPVQWLVPAAVRAIETAVALACPLEPPCQGPSAASDRR